MVNLGQSICIRGELTGDEDLTLDGKMEGKINLQDHNLTIGPGGRIKADVSARTVMIRGKVTGNITAHEKVELAATGRLKGDIVAPRIAIADGAQFKGSVDMSGGKEEAPHQTSSTEASKSKKSAPAETLITDGPAEKTPAAPLDRRVPVRPNGC